MSIDIFPLPVDKFAFKFILQVWLLSQQTYQKTGNSKKKNQQIIHHISLIWKKSIQKLSGIDVLFLMMKLATEWDISLLSYHFHLRVAYVQHKQLDSGLGTDMKVRDMLQWIPFLLHLSLQSLFQAQRWLKDAQALLVRRCMKYSKGKDLSFQLEDKPMTFLKMTWKWWKTVFRVL